MSVVKSQKQRLTTPTEDQIKTLIKLQELFHSKCLTLDLVNEIISIYVNLIQCFDQRLLPFRTYFLSKIQFVVTRKQVLKLLQSNDEDRDIVRETIRLTNNGGFTNQQLGQIYQQTTKQSKFKEHAQRNDPASIKERNMKVQLQMKVMRQLEQGVKNMTKQASNMDKKAQKHDKEITNIFKNQQTSLQQRLMARRKRKPRKKSADQVKTNNEDQEPQPVMNKEELLVAQREVAQAVVRITLRMTEKSLGLGMLTSAKKPQKGRMKMARVQQDSDQQKHDEVFSPMAMKKKQNNVFEAQGRKESSHRVGTAHDPKDKGRVTKRKRTSSSQDQ